MDSLSFAEVQLEKTASLLIFVSLFFMLPPLFYLGVVLLIARLTAVFVAINGIAPVGLVLFPVVLYLFIFLLWYGTRKGVLLFGAMALAIISFVSTAFASLYGVSIFVDCLNSGSCSSGYLFLTGFGFINYALVALGALVATLLFVVYLLDYWYIKSAWRENPVSLLQIVDEAKYAVY